jgi:hypothetical protein
MSLLPRTTLHSDSEHFLLLTDSRNWHTATNSFELQQEAYIRY